ncbi:MAG: sulfatase-like hydrolase/transferase, partial [Planctomycetes bacterium]|nr:sulfatase-like hydrolase/transferase [Planctomycetota bacterium]
MSKPNIVFILVDDMGYGDFSAFNYGASRTPALDHLMNEGVCLSQHYSAAPMCAPARASLQTGRYHHRTGSIDTVETCALCRMSLRETTVADLLKRAGYATGLVGKWHNGGIDPRYHPNARGFDEFVGFRAGWWDYYDWTLDYNDSVRKADGRYLTDVFTEEAVSFIDRHKDEPFFLNVAYNCPHDPFQAPEEEITPFLETGKFNRGVSTLYGMLRRMDKGVEQILARLDAHGLRDNTIVLFTSDNGP